MYISNQSWRQHLRLAGCVVLLLGTLTLRAVTEDTIKKGFAVGPGGKLILQADRGSIEVKSSEADRVEVLVKREVRRGTQRAAECLLKNHEVTFSQDGNTITVRGETKGGTVRSWFSWWRPNLQVHYAVALPKKFNLDMKTAGGSITVGDLTGEVRVQTAGGRLSLGAIDGPIYGRTAGGSISVESCTQPVEVGTAGGSIRLGALENSAKAETSGGSIHVGSAKGRLSLDTSGGSISIDRAASTVKASTSGGSITAALAGQPAEPCVLNTAGGSITVSLAQNVAVDLEARTSGGRVSCEIPLSETNEKKASLIRGKINGGGPPLTVHTSGGSISIVRL